MTQEAIELAAHNIKKVYAAGKNWRKTTVEIRKDLKERIRSRGENWNDSLYWTEYRNAIKLERDRIYKLISIKQDKKEFDDGYSRLTFKRGAIDKLYNML